MLILPSNCFCCNKCKKWKPLEEFTPDKRGNILFKKSCRECVNKGAAAARESARKQRTKERMKEVPYKALVKMCKEHPEVFQKIINVDPNLFRSVFIVERDRFLEHEEKLTRERQKRPQSDPIKVSRQKREFHANKRYSWMPLTNKEVV